MEIHWSKCVRTLLMRLEMQEVHLDAYCSKCAQTFFCVLGNGRHVLFGLLRDKSKSSFPSLKTLYFSGPTRMLHVFRSLKKPHTLKSS